MASPMPTSGGRGVADAPPGGTGANVFARRRSTPALPDRPATDSAAASSALDDVVDAEASASAGRAGWRRRRRRCLAGDAEELVEPKQKKSCVRPTSDVFSSILGSSRDGTGARAEPLNRRTAEEKSGEEARIIR